MRAFVLALLLCAGCAPAPAADAPPVPIAAPAADAPTAAPIDLRAPTDPPPLPPAHLACRVDADCVRVFRRCGTCDCGAPIARDFAAADAAEREARCRDDIAPQCEMQCANTTPRCAAGRCELARDAASSPR